MLKLLIRLSCLVLPLGRGRLHSDPYLGAGLPGKEDCQQIFLSFHEHTISPTKRLTLFLLLLNLLGHITCFNRQNVIHMTLPVLGLSLKRLGSFYLHHFGSKDVWWPGLIATWRGMEARPTSPSTLEIPADYQACGWSHHLHANPSWTADWMQLNA